LKVFVTGASGFVGRHLVAHLQSCGMTVATERRELGPDTAWHDLLGGMDAVVHAAGLAHERATRASDEELRRVNVLGSERLARDAAAAGVRHLVFLSTIGVLGDETHGAAFTDASAPAPRTSYARSKREAEQALARIAGQSGMALSILRPTLVYGPGNGGNMLRLLRAIERGWPLPFGAVKNRRTLAYIDNVTSGIAAALRQGSGAGALIICDGESVSTPELIAGLAQGMARTARLFSLPPALLLGLRKLTSSLEADCAGARRILAWRPAVGAAEGLERTGHWWRQTPW